MGLFFSDTREPGKDELNERIEALQKELECKERYMLLFRKLASEAAMYEGEPRYTIISHQELKRASDRDKWAIEYIEELEGLCRRLALYARDSQEDPDYVSGRGIEQAKKLVEEYESKTGKDVGWDYDY